MVRPNSGGMLTNDSCCHQVSPAWRDLLASYISCFIVSFYQRKNGGKKVNWWGVSSYRYMITGATKETLFRTELTGQEKKSLLWKQSYACLGNRNTENLLFATQSSHKDKSRIELSTTRFKAFQFPKKPSSKKWRENKHKDGQCKKKPVIDRGWKVSLNWIFFQFLFIKNC